MKDDENKFNDNQFFLKKQKVNQFFFCFNFKKQKELQML